MEQEELVVGCGDLAAVQVLAEIIESFHKKYPLVKHKWCNHGPEGNGLFDCY